MRAVKRLPLSFWPLCGLVFLFLVPARSGHTAPAPVSRDEQGEINQAIDRGVVYLKKTQQPTGTWATSDKHSLGYAALPALALLESGVPPTDPVIRRAATFVRRAAPLNQKTYELSLSILFLDRLGNPRDKDLIQVMALRLVAGQGTTGGWTYRCPILPKNFQRDILTILRRLDPPEDKKDGDPLGPIVARKAGDPLGPIVARKAGEPLERGPARPREGLEAGPARVPDKAPLEDRATSGPSAEKPGGALPPLQEPLRPVPAAEGKPAPERPAVPAKPKAAGQQPQKPPPGPVVIPNHLKAMPIFQDLVTPSQQSRRVAALRTVSDNSNTQFALLGLWVAQRHGVPMKRTLQLLVQRFQDSQHEDGSWGYKTEWPKGEPAMTCVGLMGLAVGHALTSAANPDKEGRALDPRIPQGFVALREFLDSEPAPNLYFLWSLERVAVLYELSAIGDKDWYRYGVKFLLPSQQRDGSWARAGYPGGTPTIDTCLALLFLKRANFIEDLTKKLKVDREALDTFIKDRQSVLKSSSSLAPQKDR